VGRYVMAYTGGAQPDNTSEEERAAVMAAWGAWYGTMGEAVVDGGNPFGPSMVVTPGGAQEGAPSGLTGYTIVSADSLAAATDLARGCPHLESGGSVEVYETFDVM